MEIQLSLLREGQRFSLGGLLFIKRFYFDEKSVHVTRFAPGSKSDGSYFVFPLEILVVLA